VDIEQRFAALEQRLRLVEDQEQIRECLARYGFNFNLSRARQYAETFTPDGVFDFDDGKFVGAAALAGVVTDYETTDRVLRNRSLHTVCNLYIRVDGDTAWAEGYSVVVVRNEEMFGVPFGVFEAGYNHWDFERDGERWRIKRRVRRSVGGKQYGGEVISQYLKDDVAA
jgi:hypothetical protein